MADNNSSLGSREIERLIDWMRRSGRPQTAKTLARRYIEMLREDRGIKDNAARKA